MQIKTPTYPCDINRCQWPDKEKRMRFYFDISDRRPIRDEIGRDFDLTSAAVLHARYLAADLRCLENEIRPGLSIQVFCEGREQIHEEGVFR